MKFLKLLTLLLLINNLAFSAEADKKKKKEDGEANFDFLSEDSPAPSDREISELLSKGFKDLLQFHKEQAASKEKVIYLFDKKLAGKIEKTVEGQNICFNVDVIYGNDPGHIICSKKVTTDGIHYFYTMNYRRLFWLCDGEEREQDYFERLEILYDQQNNEESSDKKKE